MHRIENDACIWRKCSMALSRSSHGLRHPNNGQHFISGKRHHLLRPEPMTGNKNKSEFEHESLPFSDGVEHSSPGFIYNHWIKYEYLLSVNALKYILFSLLGSTLSSADGRHLKNSSSYAASIINDCRIFSSQLADCMAYKMSAIANAYYGNAW